MNKKISWSILFLLIILFAHSASSKGKNHLTPIDSLRIEININKGSGKISAQPDLALRLLKMDKHEARSLADSALFAAKITRNKNLEMRAYFTLERISQVLDKKDLSEARYGTALTMAEASGDNRYQGEIRYQKGVNKHNSREDRYALEYFNAD